MHDLPRQLSARELAELFAGTSIADRLANVEDPLRQARSVLASLHEEEQVAALNEHPAIGARGLSAASAREQGAEDDSDLLAELDRLNRAYERKFGFRFVVFVNRRPRSEIVPVLRERLRRTRREELETGLDELVAIAHDRWQRTQQAAEEPGDET